MGIIQNAINKTLGTVGIVARFGLEKKQKQAILEEKQKQAMQKVAEKQAAKQKQRRNFKEYLKQQPIAGGGTIGQLSDKAISQIAKQYSPKQRKKIMDTMDKEKMSKNGK
jgi:hypothetical protein